MEFWRSLHGLYVESMWTSPNITLSLLGIYMDFIWSLHGVHKESSYNPHKEEDFSGSPFTVPQGLIKDSAGTPRGVY
jgi:hypothetical protein